MKKIFFTITLISGVISPTSSLLPPHEIEGENFIKYKSKEFYIEYLDSWKPLNAIWHNYNYTVDPYLNAQELWGIADTNTKTPWEKYTTSVRILKKQLSPDCPLQEIFEQTYKSMPEPIQIVEKGSKKFGEHTHPYIIYKRPHGENWYQFLDVWKHCNNAIYIISCKCLPQNFEKTSKIFTHMINSLVPTPQNTSQLPNSTHQNHESGKQQTQETSQ